MAEERKRVQAAEKKLKMVDVPLSEVKDDTRLKQHEKEILVQEVSPSHRLTQWCSSRNSSFVVSVLVLD